MASRTGPEQAVIGTLMIDPSDEITSFIVGYLEADDFADNGMRLIYATILELYKKKQPIDVISVSEFGGHDIAILADVAGTGFIQNCRNYAKMVKTESYRRKAIRQAEGLIRTIAGNVYTSPEEIVDLMNSFVMQAIPSTKREPETMEEVVDMLIDVTETEYNNKKNAMRYGFRDLDANMGGLRPSEMTVVAAGPGTGKTAFMMHVAANVARQHRNVLVFSREMSQIQIAKRVISSVCLIEAEKIRDGRLMSEETYTELVHGAMRVRGLPIFIDSKTQTIEAISNKAMRYKEKGTLDLICIDYFQLLRSAGRQRDRRLELDHISRELKMLALELNIPIILLSQINRETRKTGEQPELHSLRETGALEQDADNVIFIWDPNESDKETQRDTAQLDVEILVKKQRSGRTGKVKMRFDKVHQRFLVPER